MITIIKESERNAQWTGEYRVDTDDTVVYFRAADRDEAREYARSIGGVELTDGSECEIL